MNKIEIVNDEVISKNINDTITLNVTMKNDFFNVNILEFHIVKDTTLEINYKSLTNSKLEIVIHVCPNVTFHLLEVREGIAAKVRYKYYLNENSTTNVFLLEDADYTKEMTHIYLKEEGATLNYYLKSFTKVPNDFDYIVNHEAKNTTSNLYLNSVSFEDGESYITTSGFVPNGILDCTLNHMSRVIQLNDKVSILKPNLFIDECNVSANHSAHIGQFSKEELFYLQSRGIKKDDAISLLTKGFLCSYITNEDMLNKIGDGINRYWR